MRKYHKPSFIYILTINTVTDTFTRIFKNERTSRKSQQKHVKNAVETKIN